MKKFLSLVLLAGIFLAASSCESDDDATTNNVTTTGILTGPPITSTTGTYYPLVQGNSYTYNSSYFGEYTVTIGGKKSINGVDYTIENSNISRQSPQSYTLNVDDHVTTVTENPTAPGENIEIVVLNIATGIGGSWEAGSVSTSEAGINLNHTYTGTIVRELDSYTTPNGTRYDNILQTTLTTVIKASIDEVGLSQYPESSRDLIRQALEANIAVYNQTIESTTYYALNVGLIYQESEQLNQLLMTELTSKNF